jgi:hypothetical protein
VASKTANGSVSTDRGLHRASSGFSDHLATAKQKRKTQFSLPSISADDMWPTEAYNYNDCESEQDVYPEDVDPIALSDSSLDTLDIVSPKPALHSAARLRSRSVPHPSCPRYLNLPPRRCSAITNHFFSRRGAWLRSRDLALSDQRAFPPSFRAVDF